jgi:hypothetical protein
MPDGDLRAYIVIDDSQSTFCESGTKVNIEDQLSTADILIGVSAGFLVTKSSNIVHIAHEYGCVWNGLALDMEEVRCMYPLYYRR